MGLHSDGGAERLRPAIVDLLRGQDPPLLYGEVEQRRRLAESDWGSIVFLPFHIRRGELEIQPGGLYRRLLTVSAMAL